MLASNAHFEARGAQFLVRHYAGDVMYNVAGMTDKNKDSLVKDLLDLVAGSGNQFLQTLFPDRVDPNSKKRPPTAGDRIKVYNYYPVFHVQLIDLYHPGVSWCPRREFDESSAILHSNDQTKSESQLVGV
jgi:hypothetical protein